MRRLVQEWQTHGTRRFAQIRARKATNKIQRSYYRMRGTAYVPSRYGVLMAANWKDTTFRFCIDATYGYDLADLLTNKNTPFVFLDIGANQGIYSLIAANNKHCKKVFSFEPMPDTFELLNKNVTINKLDDKTITVNSAVSNQAGSAVLTLNPQHSGGATLHGHESETYNSQTVTVNLIDHTELSNLVPADTEIVVKVDVEGHEETVFSTLAKCAFKNSITTLHYEVDEHWTKPDQLRQLATDIGLTRFERQNTRRTHHYDIVASR